MPLQAALQEWTVFFSVAGTAAGIGVIVLLIVGLQHRRPLAARPDLRGLATVIATSFSLVLAISIMAATLEDQSWAMGRLLIGVAAAACLAVMLSLITAMRSAKRMLGSIELSVRFVPCLLGYITVVAAGWLLLGGANQSALTSAGVATVVLLASSARNTWDLLMSVESSTPTDAGRGRPTPPTSP